MTQDEYDVMTAVVGLVNAGWSFRKIARFGELLPTGRDAVKSLYTKALDELDTDNSDNLPKSRKSIDLRYVGDTSDVEYLDGAIHHNVCGGGRKVHGQRYED